MRKTLSKLLRHWRRDITGGAAVIFGLTTPVIIGGGVFGLEVGTWYYDRVKLQQAADAGAYAAGIANLAGQNYTTMLATATSAATINGYDSAKGTLTLNTPPTSGSNQNPNATEVLLTRTEPQYFTKIFGLSPAVVRARSVASYVMASNACILALDPTVSRAVQFSGSSTVNLNGCSVMANSIAPDSIYSQGATNVTVPCLLTAGDVQINTYVHMTACTSAVTNLPIVRDPYKDVAEPAVTGNCKNDNGATLQPGRYCGGLTLNGNKNLQPGTYIVDGGVLRSNGSANISGTGVTFYLANNARVSLNGNAYMNVTAPTSGTYSGILFFGSRTNSYSSDISLNGTADSALTGVIYAPAQPVTFIGDMEGANGCTQIVSKTISWNGNATLALDCSAYGMSNLAVGGKVALKE
jgi:hypothetical protein